MANSHATDGRPFFSMKLIEGRTLADLLHERRAADDDLPRFLGIFQQVCQAVGFAHSRGVIHRDLKPANVMVGSFGEVQVMDWGMAKPISGAADSAIIAFDNPSRSTFPSPMARPRRVAGPAKATIDPAGEPCVECSGTPRRCVSGEAE